jgi:hypothetical protein
MTGGYESLPDGNLAMMLEVLMYIDIMENYTQTGHKLLARTPMSRK